MAEQEKGGPKTIDIEGLDPQFKYRVAEEPGGENIRRCFACGICTAGCPVSEIDEEYNPRRIIRMVLLGMKDEVLSSDFIWSCTMCYTCYARCPQNVKFTDIMDALRNIAVREGYVDPSFLRHVRDIDTYSQSLRRKLMRAFVDRKGSPSSFDEAAAAQALREILQEDT